MEVAQGGVASLNRFVDLLQSDPEPSAADTAAMLKGGIAIIAQLMGDVGRIAAALEEIAILKAIAIAAAEDGAPG